MLKFAGNQLKLVQNLLLELFDASQLRKFVGDWGGRSIAHQIPPEVVSPEILAHGITLVLEKNGMLEEQLFVELYRERPNRKAIIDEVAKECGVAVPVEADLSGAPKSISIRTPDYVVQHAYESLRAQRDLLRTFFQGPVSIHGIIENLRNAQDLALTMESIRAWIREHAGAFAFAPVRNALHQLGLLAAGMGAKDSTLQGITALAAMVLMPQLEGQLKGLARFASLTESEVYAMALQQLDVS